MEWVAHAQPWPRPRAGVASAARQIVALYARQEPKGSHLLRCAREGRSPLATAVVQNRLRRRRLLDYLCTTDTKGKGTPVHLGHTQTNEQNVRSILAANLYPPDGVSRVSRIHGTVRWECDLSGRCHSPVWVGLQGRPSAAVPRGPYISTDLWVRCRKCDWCMRQRRMMWARRAQIEIRSSLRTWFCTLTFRPEVHYLLGIRGTDHVAEAAKEVTKYLKRLRKETGARFRYMLVVEKHQNGLPHFHMLLHEIGVPVRHEVLRRQWEQNGFGTWKLVEDQRAAWYCAKYLGKTAEARVRASIRYGEPEPPVGRPDDIAVTTPPVRVERRGSMGLPQHSDARNSVSPRPPPAEASNNAHSAEGVSS